MHWDSSIDARYEVELTCNSTENLVGRKIKAQKILGGNKFRSKHICSLSSVGGGQSSVGGGQSSIDGGQSSIDGGRSSVVRGQSSIDRSQSAIDGG